uniref:Uncharacterized protein n=1 Tax=Timema shepardi TaxID=629360 RepID=A0A7R9B0J5_TIMSH|nr:unnamed protein product [Timema shepardi]
MQGVSILEKRRQRNFKKGGTLQLSLILKSSDPSHSSTYLKQTSDDIPSTTKYHPGLKRINTILKNGYNFLVSSTQTQNLLGSPPKLLDPNKIFTSINTAKGSHPCMNTCKTFDSKNTKKQYPIHGNTSNLIYQLQCNFYKPVSSHINTNNKDFDSCYITRVLKAFLIADCNNSQLRLVSFLHICTGRSNHPPYCLDRSRSMFSEPSMTLLPL